MCLLGVALDELPGWLGDRLAVAEGLRQIATLDEPKKIPATVQKRDITAGKSVDRLPVVAGQEIGHAGSPQGTEQRETPRRDILELVNQHVPKRRQPLTFVNGVGRMIDHVLEIDRVFTGK